jgi:hypothetical protein
LAVIDPEIITDAKGRSAQSVKPVETALIRGLRDPKRAQDYFSITTRFCGEARRACATVQTKADVTLTLRR